MFHFSGLCLVLLLTASASAHRLHDHPTHRCVHDELSRAFKPSLVAPVYSNADGSRLLQTTERFLRIKIDYSNSDAFIQANSKLSSLYTMSKRILVNTKKYFESFLKVKTAEKMTLAAQQCQTVTTNAITQESIDLYIIIKAEDNSAALYFAAAGACAQDSTTGRPIAGVYYLNFASMKGTKMFEYFYFTTYTHEFMHIIFFSQSLFDQYRNPATGLVYSPKHYKEVTVNNKNIYILTFPNLVAFAKKYYNCDTIDGVPLEDGGGQGTAGSHWEKLFLNEDIMNPTIENPARISPFTVELIKATGWYTVVGDPYSPYDWGKGSGCIFTSAACPTTREYCPAGSNTIKNYCSPDFLGKATCSSLTDYFGSCLVKRKMEVSCLLNLPDEINMGAEEIYGPHSRCIPWEKKDNPEEASGECHAVRCLNGEVQIRLKGGITKTCRYEGEKIVFPGQWQINCPDPAALCSTFSHRCPMDCYGTNGYCLAGGKCFCFEGFTGEDCGTCSGCSKVTDPYILSSKLGGDFIEVDPQNFQTSASSLQLLSLLKLLILWCLWSL